jgi:hypothetical protein
MSEHTGHTTHTPTLRSRGLLAAGLGGLIALRVAWHPSAGICGAMTMAGCLSVAAGVVLGVNLAAIAVRAGWLATRTARAVGSLPRTTPPPALTAAAHRCHVARLSCVDGANSSAFCAGLLRPRVYISAGTAAMLSADELDAILTHEQVHAHRRDPLRYLLHRAAVDVLFFLPLAAWWRARSIERTECRADRSSIAHVGAPTVAGALLAAEGQAPPAAATFDAAIEARIRQLTGEPAPPRRLPRLRLLLSLLGLVGAVSLAMCTGQAAAALLGTLL